MSEKMTFEEGMQTLETLVRQLESGNMTLDESFVAYERASKLRAQLSAMLDEGDKRIRVLTETGERPMEGEDAL